MMSQLTLAAGAAAAAAAVVLVAVLVGAAADALGEALAWAPFAVWLRFVECPPLAKATTATTARPSATGTATGTAMRATRF
jgi:hypothetical protein